MEVRLVVAENRLYEVRIIYKDVYCYGNNIPLREYKKTIVAISEQEARQEIIVQLLDYGYNWEDIEHVSVEDVTDTWCFYHTPDTEVIL